MAARRGLYPPFTSLSRIDNTREALFAAPDPLPPAPTISRAPRATLEASCVLCHKSAVFLGAPARIFAAVPRI